MKTAEIAGFFDDLLELPKFAADCSNNGLQICFDKMAPCRKIAFAVDASQASIDQAIADNADMLVVHHGLSWGPGVRRWDGITGRRLGTAFKNDLALYAVHLPLDAHALYGNNAVLSDLIRLGERQMFFPYCGIEIGMIGQIEPSAPESAARAAAAGKEYKMYISPLKDSPVQKIAVISGGAGMDGLAAAIEEGADMLITGEFDHTMYHLVQENAIHVAALGHYASEVHGVKALQKLVTEKFGLETVFLDIPTGL